MRELVAGRNRQNAHFGTAVDLYGLRPRHFIQHDFHKTCGLAGGQHTAEARVADIGINNKRAFAGCRDEACQVECDD